MAADRGLVTPEAVRLDFPEATVGSRGVAFIVDWLVRAVALSLLSLGTNWVVDPIAPSGGPPPWVPVTVALLVSFAVVFGYPIGFETLWAGQTPGKALLGLRVATVEGGPVRFRHAAIRAALGLVDFGLTFGVGAVLSPLLSSRNQRLGDLVAGTVVLRERTGAPAAKAQRFTVPPGAEAFAATLDASGLSTRDYQALRSYLMRAASLPEPQRTAVGERLAAAVAPRLGATRPADQPVEVFLRCVAARYQQRGRSAPAIGPPTHGRVPAEDLQPPG